MICKVCGALGSSSWYWATFFRTPSGIFSVLDIFFVLSGFLITGILLDMHARFGRIYFIPFYLSRMRRLLPTAAVVILVTTGLYYMIFSQARGQAVALDGFWAFIFAVNWHFAAQQRFQEQLVSPFLHYWSLSIEEQLRGMATAASSLPNRCPPKSQTALCHFRGARPCDRGLVHLFTMALGRLSHNSVFFHPRSRLGIGG